MSQRNEENEIVAKSDESNCSRNIRKLCIGSRKPVMQVDRKAVLVQVEQKLVLMGFFQP